MAFSLGDIGSFALGGPGGFLTNLSLGGASPFPSGGSGGLGPLQALFGGSAQESRSQQQIAPMQAPYLSQLFQQAGGLLGSGQLGRVAGFDPFQLQGQQLAAGLAGRIPGMLAPAQQALTGLLGGQPLGGALGALGTEDLPHLQAAARDITENITAATRRNALLRSGMPTSRAGLETGQAVGQALNQLYLPAIQQAQQLRQRGLEAQLGGIRAGLDYLPQITQLGMLPSQLLQDIGAQRRALEQQRLQAPAVGLGQFQSLLGAPIVLGQTTSTGASTGGIIPGLFG